MFLNQPYPDIGKHGRQSLEDSATIVLQFLPILPTPRWSWIEKRRRGINRQSFRQNTRLKEPLQQQRGRKDMETEPKQPFPSPTINDPSEVVCQLSLMFYVKANSY